VIPHIPEDYWFLIVEKKPAYLVSVISTAGRNSIDNLDKSGSHARKRTQGTADGVKIIPE
jgi:hypothetical protein